MADFEKAIRIVLKHEGGYVNNPSDLGSATNFGISLRFLKDFPTLGDINHDSKVDIQDIKQLTVAQAKKIYKQEWWDKYKYGNIVDETLACSVFDTAVNMGSKRAHILLQRALNKTFGLRLTEDGILGPATIGVINACSDDKEQKLLTAYNDEKWAFYQKIIANNPSQKVFEKGWKNRAYSLSKANSI